MLVRPSMKRLFCPKAKNVLGRFSPSALRFSGASLILSCLTVSFSCGIVYSRVKRTPESEKKKTYVRVYLTKRKIKKENVGMRTRYVYTWYLLFYHSKEVWTLTLPAERGYSWGRHMSPFVLLIALEGGVNSNPSSGERLFFRTANPTQDQKQLRTWLTRSVLPHTGDQARSVE